MVLEPGTLTTLVLGLAVVVVALAIWVALLQRSEARLRSRLRRILTDGSGDGIDGIMEKTLRQVDTMGERVDALSALQKDLSGIQRRSLQRIGIVRFNPFAETGGDQSFAIALLDAEADGVVLSSLHSRTDTRVFAKAVSGGRSKYQLSDEEQDAIRRALASRDAG